MMIPILVIFFYFRCLGFQEKPMIDIIASVDKMIQGGNVSALFSPVSNEHFLSAGSRFFEQDPESAMRSGNFKKVRSNGVNDCVATLFVNVERNFSQ